MRFNHWTVNLWVVAAVMLWGLTGCVDDTETTQSGPDKLVPEAEASSTLELALAFQKDGKVAVDLLFAKDEDKPGPRMMELFIRTSAGLTWVSSEVLSATTDAGKQLVVQAPADGTVRVLVFATDNLNRLESGPLARIVFASGGENGNLEMLNQRPIFAPAEADWGITLGKPLTVGGN